MIRFLIAKLIPDYEAVTNPVVRLAYGKLAGVLGIVSNFILFLLKLGVGVLVGSIAIMSDAFNNLSDMGSSLVSLIGTVAAGRHADEEHPFGHGRFEYVASLIVSFIIILVGFELFRSSLGKLFHYEAIEFSWWSVGILLFSMAVKLWLFLSNRHIGNKIQSVVIQAAAQDSLNDVVATGAVLLSVCVGSFVPWSLDGMMGLAISALIMFAGYRIARDTITLLLGTPPDPAVAEQICSMILEQDEIEGVHDLIIHDYGPGRCMASVHAEVPVNADIVKIHEIIDNTEKKIQEDLGIHIVIHMDPITVADGRIEEVRQSVLTCVHEVNPVLGIHDFRMTDGEKNINIIFDLEVPYSMKPAERDSVVAAIKTKLKEKDVRFNAVIQIDNKF